MSGYYHLTYAQLLQDLHSAYYDARRHKRNKPYQQRFEANLEHNLSTLCYELWYRTYQPHPSTCFIITDPKKREIFAADFRDRIVHHLYYNYVHLIFERTFIQDSYSCIKERGTHYGIRRLEHFIRKESQNYKQECFVMKMDIQGYFMNINRQLLLDTCIKRLKGMMVHRIAKHDVRTWQEVVDMDFVFYLTTSILLHNPIESCYKICDDKEWIGLDNNKSLFQSKEGCGLPIGNLTSQLFSNVYLGVLDDYMKRVLHCHYYGRYVDDFFVVSSDKKRLEEILPKVRIFLKHSLGLSLHLGKTQIRSVKQGVEFLGAYLKPWRKYISNKTLRKMRQKVPLIEFIEDTKRMQATINSSLGLLRHYRTVKIQQSLYLSLASPWRYGRFESVPNGYIFRM